MFAKKKRSYWINKLRKARMVAAPVNSMVEASNDPDIVANNYVSEIHHPRLGHKIKIHGTPWKFSETPSVLGVSSTLGEHNNGILSELGYKKEQIVKLQQKNII